MKSNLERHIQTLPCGEEWKGKKASKHQTHRVAPAQGLDVKEGKDLVALEELERRDITCSRYSRSATGCIWMVCS